MPTDRAILELAVERFNHTKDSDKKERLLALHDIRFAHNEDNCQWPDAIRRQREGDTPPRPCLSLNKIPEKIDQIEGEFRQLRPSIKVRGVDSNSDPIIAEIIGGIIRHIEYQSNARTAYNTSHSSVLYCGRGAWRVDVQDSEADPFMQDIVINRIPDVMTVYWDLTAKHADKSDADFIFITEELTEKEFKYKYPNIKQESWAVDSDVVPDWRTDKFVRVCEYWWKEQVKKIYYKINRLSEDGTQSEETVDKGGLLELDQIIEEKVVSVPTVKWCHMIYDKIIDGPFDWPSKYIPIIIETGKEANIKGHNKYRGMVRNAKTPQTMYNYWSSSTTEAIALTPKTPYLTTASMISKYQAQWDKANVKNFPYLLYDVDEKAPGSRPVREPPPQLSTAIASELMRMEHDIMAAMGVYQAQLGEEGQEKSGKAILARQKQGSMGAYAFTDHFQTALVYSMKVIIDLIPHVFDSEMVQRIRGDDGTEKIVPLNARPDADIFNDQDFSQETIAMPRSGVTEYINDMSIGKYDLVVSIGPSYDTQRHEALTMILDLVGAIPQLGPAVVDLIVQNVDIPGVDELIKRAKKIVPIGIRELEPGEQAPEPQEPSFEEKIEMERLQLETIDQRMKLFDSKVDAIAKLMTAEAKEQGEQIKAISAFVSQLQQQGGG